MIAFLKEKRNKKIIAVLFVILGSVLIIYLPVFQINERFGINSFIVGLILAFFGIIYLLDPR